MRIENFWYSPSTAAKWGKDAETIVVNPGAPMTTLEGTHTFGSVAIGGSSAVHMPEATGVFVAIPMGKLDAHEPIVFTHHDANPDNGPADGKRVGKDGRFDRDAMVFVCVPKGPQVLSRGEEGIAKGKISKVELAEVDKICEEALLPLPRVEGRAVEGRKWSDKEVMDTLNTMKLKFG